MNRRTFLRGGVCTAAGIMAGLCVDMGLITQDALARGAGADESAKAKRLFEQFGALGGGEAVHVRNGTIKLAPGEGLNFQCEGYCLDSDLAVPSENEPLAFRPMQRYIAPELRALYVAIMQNVVGGEPKGIEVQKIMYLLRDEARGSRSGTYLKEASFGFLNRLLPHGETLMLQAPRPNEFMGGSGLSLWASKPMPGEIESYSMLTNTGVAGRGIGMGNLEVRGTVINTGSQAFVFDTTQWVLESSRDVQAVGLPVASRYTLIAGRQISTNEPTSSTNAPSTSQEAPTSSTKTPSSSTKEPSTSQKAPKNSQQEQTGQTIQPDADGYIGY